MNVGDGARVMKIKSVIGSKWLGPVCSTTNE
jgi:hypothetical protein